MLLTLGASPFLIGLDAFAMSAPVWALTLVGGVLADRADRRRVITLFQSIQMLCPTLIVVLLLGGLVRPWIVIVLSLVVGITDALSMPSFSSIVPSIVERRQIAAGLALNSTQFNISRIAGPALAGVLMASVGAIACFAVSALSYIPFIGIAFWVLPRRAAPEPIAGLSAFRHPFGGAVEVFRAPYLRGALLTTLFSGLLCAPLITFAPVLVQDVFHGDAAAFSLTVGAFGVGGLIGGLGLLGVSARRDRRWLGSSFAIAHGLAIVATVLNGWFWLLPALLVLAGLAMSVTNTSTNTLLQTAAPAALRGQAVSLFMLVSRGGLAIGSLGTGALVHWRGVREAFLICGILAIAAQLVIGRAWLRVAAAPVDPSTDPPLPPDSVTAPDNRESSLCESVRGARLQWVAWLIALGGVALIGKRCSTAEGPPLVAADNFACARQYMKSMYQGQNMPPHYHAILWIDHREAKIFEFSATDAVQIVVQSHESGHHLHHKSNSPGSGHKGVDTEFFERVAKALAEDGALLVTGPSTAKLEFKNYLAEHSPSLAKRIAAVEPLDHPSDGVLLALARKFFKGNDRMQAQT